MNYSELIIDASLEQIVMVNKLVDYLLEQKSRTSEEHLRAIKMAGEIFEAEKFKQMMPEPEPEPITEQVIDDIILTVECLERVKKTGCAYPNVLKSAYYPLSKGVEDEIQKHSSGN